MAGEWALHDIGTWLNLQKNKLSIFQSDFHLSCWSRDSILCSKRYVLQCEWTQLWPFWTALCGKFYYRPSLSLTIRSWLSLYFVVSGKCILPETVCRKVHVYVLMLECRMQIWAIQTFFLFFFFLPGGEICLLLSNYELDLVVFFFNGKLFQS